MKNAKTLMVVNERSPIRKIFRLIHKGVLLSTILHFIIRLLTIKKIDYYNCNYDEIVSLGYNCEVSQRFCDIFINSAFEHFLFTWSYERDRYLFLSSLEKLENDFTNSNYYIVESGMIRHENSGIEFHSRFEKNELIDINGGMKSYTKNYYIALVELKSRLSYLAEKTETMFRTKQKILFVMKMLYSNLEEDIEFVNSLSKTIESKLSNINSKYTILIVLSKKNYPNKDLKLLLNTKFNNVQFETVKSFANDKRTDISGDILGWHKIFRKYIVENN